MPGRRPVSIVSCQHELHPPMQTNEATPLRASFFTTVVQHDEHQLAPTNAYERARRWPRSRAVTRGNTDQHRPAPTGVGS